MNLPAALGLLYKRGEASPHGPARSRGLVLPPSPRGSAPKKPTPHAGKRMRQI
jgi:hypothetical protein